METTSNQSCSFLDLFKESLSKERHPNLLVLGTPGFGRAYYCGGDTPDVTPKKKDSK